jgi:hypothetical protein
MATRLTLFAQDFIDPKQGPDPSGEFRVSPNAVITIFGLGFLLGIFGHLFKSKTMVAAGIGLIFLATMFLPIYLSLTR